MHVLASMGVGAQLRRAREARGLTVRDIADATKIPTRQIDAIESEHYEKLPGGIFGRGYVRAVALALRLDGDAIVSAYRDETEPERSAVQVETGPAEPARRPQSAQQVSMAWRMEQSEPRIRMAPADLVVVRSPARWVAAVLIGLGAILLILWLGRDHSAAPLSAVRPEASTVSASRTPAKDVAARRDASAAPAPAATSSRTAPPPAPRTERPIGTVGEAGTAAPPAAPATTATPGPVDLLIVADRTAWLVLNVDGQRIARRRLQPREAVRVQMRTHATLHTGDAGALRMSMNGGAFTTLGPAGAVRTIEIAPPAP